MWLEFNIKIKNLGNMRLMKFTSKQTKKFFRLNRMCKTNWNHDENLKYLDLRTWWLVSAKSLCLQRTLQSSKTENFPVEKLAAILLGKLDNTQMSDVPENKLGHSVRHAPIIICYTLIKMAVGRDWHPWAPLCIDLIFIPS